MPDWDTHLPGKGPGQCYIISRTDTFVCVLPSAVTEGGNKFQQRILAFVLAKVQVTASTGKRGKHNMVAAYWQV